MKKSSKIKWEALSSYRDVKVYEDKEVDREEKYKQKEKKETIALLTTLNEFSRNHGKYKDIDHWSFI